MKDSTSVLFSLVGGSAIPVLLGAKDLLSPDGVHHLICSPETRNIAERTRDILVHDCPPQHHPRDFCRISELRSAKDPQAILEDLEQMAHGIQGRPHKLHYTGGTKAMSAVALVVFANAPEGAWYLDPATNTYHGFGGAKVHSNSLASLDETLYLHGFKCRPSGSFLNPSWMEMKQYMEASRNSPSPPNLGFKFRDQSVDEWNGLLDIAREFTGNREVADRIEQWKTGEGLDVWQAARQLADIVNDKLEGAFPSAKVQLADRGWPLNLSDEPPSSIEDPLLQSLREGIKFILTTWLEEFVCQGIRHAMKGRDIEVYESHNLWRESLEVNGQIDLRSTHEVDVLLVRPNGLTIVSVTKSAGSTAVREKMSEAVLLAHQIGGNLANAVVVSPIAGIRKRAASLTADPFTPGWICSWAFLESLMQEDWDQAAEMVLSRPRYRSSQ